MWNKQGAVRICRRLELSSTKQAGGYIEELVHLRDPAVVTEATILAVVRIVSRSVLDVDVVGDGVVELLDRRQQLLSFAEARALSHERT